MKLCVWLNLDQLQLFSVPAAMKLEDVFVIFQALVSDDNIICDSSCILNFNFIFINKKKLNLNVKNCGFYFFHNILFLKC